MTHPHRKERLGREMMREVAKIVIHEISDPRMGFTSVTRVEVSPDLETAKVFVSVLGNRKVRALTMQALKSAKGFVQRELGRRIKIREIPALSFVHDDSIEKTFQVTKLIDEVAKEHPTEQAQPPAKEEE